MKLSQFKPTLKSTALAAGGAIAGGIIGRDKGMGTYYFVAGGAVLGFVAGSLIGSAPTSKRLSDGKYNARMNRVPDIKPIGSWHRNKWAGDLELYDYRLWKGAHGLKGHFRPHFIEVNEGDVTKLFSVNKDIINAFSADELDQSKIEFFFEMGAFEDPIYTIDNDLTFGKHKKNYEKWIKDGRQYTKDGKPDPSYFI